ncbi:MAG: hypothetical protein NTX22_17685 [Ignavibacteriales bacterium]|nr:hypothetical protein [Ignavibacteriales bacterium]
MQTIQLPYSEYQSLKEQIKLLKDGDLLKKVNRLLDILYQEKYGLYLGEYTEDLTEHAVNNLEDINNKWDAI